MTFPRRAAIALLALLASAPLVSRAQQQQEYANNFKYNRGQSVQPVFEGWSRRPDGSIDMHFGYLNRNYAELPSIPIGPNNRIEPGGPDRGQPTYFYTRTHRNLFTVTVPKEWGKADELVWTLTHNGRTEKAVGWLQPEWEIDPVGGASGGGSTDPEFKANKPPSITIDPPAAVALHSAASLTASVSDDGLPQVKPRNKPPVGQETPPTLVGGTDAPVNVPQVAARDVPIGPTGRPVRPDGLTVSWIVWRGPADVDFEPRYAQPENGKTVTKATFHAAGDYVLRATAFDGFVGSKAQVAVTVSGATTTPGGR